MINFHKYHGAGNDFIMINNLDKSIFLTPEDISLYCDRNFGIGADGVILLEPSTKADLSRRSESTKADCFMNYYNSDGSIAQMCGNGARCTAKFYLKETGKDLKEINLDTRAGIKNIKVNDDDSYSVDMGLPVFESSDFPAGVLNIEGYEFNCVSMGNPHAVALIEDLNKIDLQTIGPKIENNENFPNKINVEFVQKIMPARNAFSIADVGGDDYYKVKVWERGCGATLACGTGACAVYAILNKLAPKQGLGAEVVLEFPGGKLYLSENHEGHIILRGPATFVFEGEI